MAAGGGYAAAIIMIAHEIFERAVGLLDQLRFGQHLRFGNAAVTEPRAICKAYIIGRLAHAPVFAAVIAVDYAAGKLQRPHTGSIINRDQDASLMRRMLLDNPNAGARPQKAHVVLFNLMVQRAGLRPGEALIIAVADHEIGSGRVVRRALAAGILADHLRAVADANASRGVAV